MTLVTLVTGAHMAAREAALVATIDTAVSTALILEGMPDGSNRLDGLGAKDTLRIVRIAPGCPCCVGNLTLRVTLNRILRRPPVRLYISLADDTHLDQIRGFLSAPPYDALLTLTDVMHCHDTE
ncbi:MAG TPA: GTPase [Oxalobacteraceae bacterium]|nr:GTPase [Oxalobacteraceae bacterium]HCN90085.1 GTPase [Oxalobacteraceae bacterium]